MGSETKTQNGFTCQQWSHTKVRQLVMQFAQFANCNIICFLIKEKTFTRRVVVLDPDIY